MCTKIKFYGSIEKKEGKNMKNEKHKANTTALVVQVLSIISCILGMILAMMSDDAKILVFVFPIVAVFTYAFGEVIQLLQNIADNTKS